MNQETNPTNAIIHLLKEQLENYVEQLKMDVGLVVIIGERQNNELS